MNKAEIEVDGDVLINGKSYPAIKLLKILNKLGILSFDVDTGQLILDDVPIKPIRRFPRKKVLSQLCYHSLAYCCPINQKCDKRDTALKMLNISSQRYTKLKEALHLQFLKFESSVPTNDPEDIRYDEDNLPYFETSESQPVDDDEDLTSLFGTPEDTNSFSDEITSEKQNSEDFLQFLSGNTFERNSWENSSNEREVRYGRKNVPSRERNSEKMNYYRRCPQCGTRYSKDVIYCSRCGAELRD